MGDDELEKAPRSVRCTLENASGHALRLVSEELAHGVYVTPPPATIAARSSATWSSRSAGFMTGTEGTAVFAIGTTEATLTIWWDNPFVGENQFTQTLAGALPQGQHYQPRDPFSPPRAGLRPYGAGFVDPEKLRHADNADAPYVLQIDEDRPADGPPPVEARDAAPDPTEPRAAEVPGADSTVLRDPHAVARKIVYLGLNPMMLGLEVGALASTAPRLSRPRRPKEMAVVTGTGSGDHERLKREWRVPLDSPADVFFAHVRVPPAAQQQLAALEAAGETVMVATDTKKPKPIERSHPGRRLAIAALAELLAQVEDELAVIDTLRVAQPDVAIDAAPMKRLVLSSHHWPSMTGWTAASPKLALDVLWGDITYNVFTYDWVLTMFGDLRGVCRIFPRAAGQVEDLHLSACATGVHPETANGLGVRSPDGAVGPSWTMLDDPRWLEMFPALQTVWACEGHSEDCATALLTWGRASTPAGAGGAIDEASKEFRKPRPNRYRTTGDPQKMAGATVVQTIVWLRGAKGMEPQICEPADPKLTSPCV